MYRRLLYVLQREKKSSLLFYMIHERAHERECMGMRGGGGESRARMYVWACVCVDVDITRVFFVFHHSTKETYAQFCTRNYNCVPLYRQSMFYNVKLRFPFYINLQFIM